MKKLKNINICFLCFFILLFIGVKLINLISFEFIEVDDCIREIFISNQIVDLIKSNSRCDMHSH